MGVRVSAIAYSHHHADHVDGASLVLERRMGHAIDIYATTACDALVRRRKAAIPVTVVLPEAGVLDFRGVPVSYGHVGAHTSDNTYFVVDEVLHVADILHPAQVEGEFFGIASLTDYLEALATVDALQWRVMNACHGNIAWRHDLSTVRAYLVDLSTAVLVRASEAPIQSYIAAETHGYEWVAAHKRDIAKAVVADLGHRWGHLPGFETHAWTHAWWMYHQLLVLEEPAPEPAA